MYLLLIIAALVGGLVSVVVERTLPAIPGAPHALSQAVGFFVMLLIGWRRTWGIRGPEITFKRQILGALFGAATVFIIRWQLLP